MTDIVRKLIGRYPHLALGCCGVILIISSFVAANNAQLIFRYRGRLLQYHHLLMPIVGIAHVSLVALGVIMVGGAILWGLRRRRSNR